MSRRAVMIMIFIGLFESVGAQKNEKSISAGPLVSFPLDKHVIPAYRTGPGLEVMGQYNISDKSALLLQTVLASYGSTNGITGYRMNGISLFSLKGGYKYRFSPSGYYLDALVGTDTESPGHFTSISYTIGGGKRFMIKKIYFIDAGIDYIDGDVVRRLNIKATFSLLRRYKNYQMK